MWAKATCLGRSAISERSIQSRTRLVLVVCPLADRT